MAEAAAVAVVRLSSAAAHVPAPIAEESTDQAAKATVGRQRRPVSASQVGGAAMDGVPRWGVDTLAQHDAKPGLRRPQTAVATRRMRM
jgi:hypothetical protein